MPSEDRAIRVIAFSGKQADWTVWEAIRNYSSVPKSRLKMATNTMKPPQLDWKIRG